MKWILGAVVLIVLLAGFTTADRGIDPVPETQGINTFTVISAVGQFDSASELQWMITDDSSGLNGIPPLGGSGSEGTIEVISWDPLRLIAFGRNSGSTVYMSTYKENTNSNGVGSIDYTKSLETDTGAMLSGEANIEATKQLMYVGEAGSRVISDDSISVSGASGATTTAGFGLAVNTDPPSPAFLAAGTHICPFASSAGQTSPPFCNTAESSSSIDMTTANVRTSTDARFIVPSADTPVLLSHDIRVSDSEGMASAGIEVNIREGRVTSLDMQNFQLTMYDPNTGHEYDFMGWIGIAPSHDLAQEISISEFTSADGIITLFDKAMSYQSGTIR